VIPKRNHQKKEKGHQNYILGSGKKIQRMIVYISKDFTHGEEGQKKGENRRDFIFSKKCKKTERRGFILSPAGKRGKAPPPGGLLCTEGFKNTIGGGGRKECRRTDFGQEFCPRHIEFNPKKRGGGGRTRRRTLMFMSRIGPALSKNLKKKNGES